MPPTFFSFISSSRDIFVLTQAHRNVYFYLNAHVRRAHARIHTHTHTHTLLLAFSFNNIFGDLSTSISLSIYTYVNTYTHCLTLFNGHIKFH